MTNKEAVEWLKGIVILFFGRGYYYTQRREALELAIKVLEDKDKEAHNDR